MDNILSWKRREVCPLLQAAETQDLSKFVILSTVYAELYVWRLVLSQNGYRVSDTFFHDVTVDKANLNVTTPEFSNLLLSLHYFCHDFNQATSNDGGSCDKISIAESNEIKRWS